MTAATVDRMTDSAGPVPSKGSIPVAAGVLILKGTIVVQDGSGNGAAPGAGLNAIGIAAGTYDNRSGLAGAVSAQLEYGVFGFAYTGTTPIASEVVYVVDNQTVSIDSAGGTRGVAGVVSEVANSKAYVWIGPHVSALADETEALQVVTLGIPINSFMKNDGTPLIKFNSGVADGLALVDSKSAGYEINTGSTTVIMASVKLPDDLDVTQPIKLHVRGSRIGTTDTTATLTPHAFAQSPGALHDAGSDLCSGDMTAFSAAASKQVTDVVATLTAPAQGDSLTITLTPKNLPTDKLLIGSVWISCSRLP